MKRKESLFEKKLIERGWKLHSKRYYGKHSEKVLSYVYYKEFETLGHKVYGYVELRRWDLKVLNVMYDNPFCEIDYLTINAIKTLFDKINGEVREILYYSTYPSEEPVRKESVEEQVEVAEALKEEDYE